MMDELYKGTIKQIEDNLAALPSNSTMVIEIKNDGPINLEAYDYLSKHIDKYKGRVILKLINKIKENTWAESTTNMLDSYTNF